MVIELRKVLPLLLLFSLGGLFGVGTLHLTRQGATGVTTPEDDPLPTQPMLLFVLAGQSNMSGRGALPGEQQPNQRIFLFGNDYRWRIATEPLDDAHNQVDRISIDDDAGFSPGLTFATTLLANAPDKPIGLIPCAKGGSAIREWGQSMSDQTLYGSCLKRIRAATTRGQIAGILFFQGEAEGIAADEAAAQVYADRFSSVIESFRRDIGDPMVPLVFAQIGSYRASTPLVNWERIKAAQSTIILPCAAMITTSDLKLQDAVHYTTPSYRLIGERFADAYIKLTTSPERCR
ncbi:MAG TPA: sialate O-acetylesterase [Thermomicrobiales bacterium]|jgi:hypothetical protein